MDLKARETESRKDSAKDMNLNSDLNSDFNFDFKPLNEGLGFHRKVKPLESDADPEDSFSFSAIGSGTLDVTSREQSKGLLSSAGSSSSTTAASGKTKHNAKSVSDLIAALPPSLDLLLDGQAAGSSSAVQTNTQTKQTGYLGGMSANNSATSSAGSRTRRSPLFGPPSDEFAKPGSPAAASMSAAATADKASDKVGQKRGFLKLPLGRNDYGMKTKGTASAPSSLDENVAKTFPSVFPHLGNLAGQPAAATVKATLKSGTVETNQVVAKATSTNIALEEVKERAIAAHFGSAVLDTLVTIGLACLLLAIALSITGANLLALLENSATDEAMMSSLAAFFVGSGLLYVLAARTWVGATLGEWSYEIRVGSEKSRSRWFYPVLVLWRGFVVAATGFVVLPLISMIAGTDVLKYLTGLQLVSMNASNDMALEGSLAVENPA